MNASIQGNKILIDPINMHKVTVIIPAFNEEHSIGNVLNDIPGDLVHEVIVVDNNSTDRTTEEAKKAGATVLSEPKQGYGYACLKGIHYVQSNTIKPDIIVFMDADYSDYPGELVNVIQPIIKDDYDFVVGSRALGKKEKGAMMPQQIFGNWLATSLMKILYDGKFTDLGPFRAIKLDKLLHLHMQDKTYGWTIEMQLKAIKHNLTYCEVPVNYKKRIGKSKVTGTIKGSVMAGIKILYSLYKYR